MKEQEIFVFTFPGSESISINNREGVPLTLLMVRIKRLSGEGRFSIYRIPKRKGVALPGAALKAIGSVNRGLVQTGPIDTSSPPLFTFFAEESLPFEIEIPAGEALGFAPDNLQGEYLIQIFIGKPC